MKSPFDGEISAYFKTNAPEDVRQAIKGATKGVMLDPAFPHRNRLKKKPYQTHYDALQIELAKFQSWVKETNQRVAIIFEGRDAAGKGGAIKSMNKSARLRHNMIASRFQSKFCTGHWTPRFPPKFMPKG